jgi:DNA-binding transcriptional LysR family regulator
LRRFEQPLALAFNRLTGHLVQLMADIAIPTYCRFRAACLTKRVGGWPTQSVGNRIDPTATDGLGVQITDRKLRVDPAFVIAKKIAEMACKKKVWIYKRPDSKVMFQHLFARSGLSLERLNVLLELEEAGSLVKAAKGDEVRQTQYSRQIKQLSGYFEVALADRQGRELKLTEHGRRLARLVREAFQGVDDFQRSCVDKQLLVSIGAGDSLIQWLVLPRVRTIQEKLRNVLFSLSNLRNEEIAGRLAEQKVDFGLMRESAVPPKHRKERLLHEEFAIFVPRKLLPSKGKAMYKQVLEAVPLVRHAPAGELVSRIAWMAEQEGMSLNTCLTCEGFPQACRAVQTGRYAAILPTIARGDLNSADFVEVEWPALKGEARWIALAWNPRQVSVRSALERVAACLKAELCKAE